MKIGEIEKQACGKCPIIEWCGEPYSELCLCTDVRLIDVKVEEYIHMADRSTLNSLSDICEEIIEVIK